MKLIVLSVLLEDKLELPDPNLEAGEFIVRRVVEISKLSDELKSGLQFMPLTSSPTLTMRSRL